MIFDWLKSRRSKASRSARVAIEPSHELTDEERCGVTDEMSAEDMGARLAFLFRRYNRAASSLDASLRDEAELVLGSVVALRRKYLQSNIRKALVFGKTKA